ncbi:hypothetical protein JCM5353_006698 [Sporobolomyces roseus]
MQAGSIQPSPPRIQWTVIERLINHIRDAFTTRGPIIRTSKELEDLLKLPWSRILSTKAQYAIYRRLFEARHQVLIKLATRKASVPNPNTAKLDNKWTSLLPTGYELLGLAKTYGTNWSTPIPRSTFDQVLIFAMAAFRDSPRFRTWRTSIESSSFYVEWDNLEVRSQQGVLEFIYTRASEAGKPNLDEYAKRMAWKRGHFPAIKWETIKALLESIQNHFQKHPPVKDRFDELETLLEPAWSRISAEGQTAIHARFEQSSQAIKEKWQDWVSTPRQAKASVQPWGSWLELMVSPPYLLI